MEEEPPAVAVVEVLPPAALGLLPLAVVPFP